VVLKLSVMVPVSIVDVPPAAPELELGTAAGSGWLLAVPVVGFTVITVVPTDCAVTVVATSSGLETPNISGAASFTSLKVPPSRLKVTVLAAESRSRRPFLTPNICRLKVK